MVPRTPAAPTAEGAGLTRFQRMLVGTDGTVSHLLEVYAGEPVEVLKLLQLSDRADTGDTHLGLAKGEGILRRRVVLRGRHTKRSLLYAEAVVAVRRVEPAFLEGLLETDKPIGAVLAELRTETFREILAVDREPAGPCAAHFGIDPAAELLVRTYRIIARRQPIVVIIEKFPAASFRDLPA